VQCNTSQPKNQSKHICRPIAPNVANELDVHNGKHLIVIIKAELLELFGNVSGFQYFGTSCNQLTVYAIITIFTGCLFKSNNTKHEM